MYTTTKIFKNVTSQQPVIIIAKISSGSISVEISDNGTDWVAVEVLTADAARKLDCYGKLVKMNVSGSVSYSCNPLVEV